MNTSIDTDLWSTIISRLNWYQSKLNSTNA